VSVVFVSGALANKPGSAGEAWVRMSWLRGLERLGHDVWFVEEVADVPDAAALAWFEDVVREFGLEARATLLQDGEAIRGPARAELLEAAAAATLVNISGHLADPGLMPAFRGRVMVDIDPGFTQFWHAEGLPGARVAGHDRHFTIGELIGTPDCPIPTGDVDWQPARQPVVLDDWPVAPGGAWDRFTSIATWRAPFGSISYGGRTYGLKHHELRKMIELPRRSAQAFEMALDIHPGDSADLEALRSNGWEIVAPRDVVGTPAAFRDYVRGSGAEFSVAQGVYVDTRCGWFSDRTTRYLASGRPALVQETGFSRFLPTGEGLVPFGTLADAVAGAEDIVARYDDHREAARRIAEDYFDSDRVLADFCSRAGIG
jgi:hypothetical protein